MVWFKVDDNLAFHRKVVAAGNSAMGLWVRAGSWCAQQLTDGFVPEHMVTMLGTSSQAAKLVKSGLWVEAPGGFAFHEWCEPGRQPSAKTVKKTRQNAAERQAVWKQRNLGGPQVRGPSNGVSHTVSNGVSNTVSDTAPSRPLSTTTTTTTKEPPPLRGAPPPAAPPGPSSNAGRGTRIPDDFAPTPEMLEWARALVPAIPIERTTEDFRDYWASKAGQAARKVDWNRTWKRWMRKTSEDMPTNRIGNSFRLATTDQRALQAQQVKAHLAAVRDNPPELPWKGAS